MRRWLLLLAIGFGVGTSATGCDGGGTFPLALEVKDNGTLAGAGGKPDEIALIVKTIPDTEVRFQGERRNVAGKAVETFVIPKSKLKLGKNTFTVEATTGVLFSKKTATATATWDAPVKAFLRFYPTGGDARNTLTCSGAMCGATNFKFENNGKLGVEAESALEGTLSLGGKKDAVGPGKRPSFELDLSSLLPTVPFAQRDTLTVPFVLEASGALAGSDEKASETFTLQGPALEAAIIKELSRVEQGPVTFAAEGAAPAEPRAIAVVNTVVATKATLLVVGKPANVTEVDLVALAKPAERFFSCGGAATSASGILYLDLELKVFERRTGRVVHTHKLMADRVACPPTPTTGQVKAEVRESDIRRALADLLKSNPLKNPTVR